ncbi:MAG: hypothetical protein ACREC4_01690 [Methylocella sp.]
MADALKDKSLTPDTPIEIWLKDEPSIRHSKALRALEPLAHSARAGQKNGLVYQ